jgi:hypothetical protein
MFIIVSSSTNTKLREFDMKITHTALRWKNSEMKMEKEAVEMAGEENTEYGTLEYDLVEC